jgi:O-antigen/teichoic acid export membrane protein
MCRGSESASGALALIDQVILGAANFATLLLLGRLAGADELGLFSLVMSVFYLILAVQESLVTIPYTVIVARLEGIARLRYSGIALRQSTVWSACIGAILALVALSLYFVGSDSSLIRVVAAFALVVPLWLVREFGRRYLFAHMQLTKLLAMSVVGATTQLMALSVLAFTNQLSAATALFAVGTGNGVAGLGWLWLSRGAFRFNRSRSNYFLLKHWVFGRWILASQGTNVLASNVMLWIVAFWLGPTATGIFAACDSILRFANPIVVSLNNILTPWAAIGLNKGGKAELRRIVWKATTVLVLFLSAFSLLTAVTGGWILNHSFGAVYAGSWATLVVLSINQLIAKLSIPAGRALLVLDRSSINMAAEAAGLLTSLAAAPLLIPRYGILGAACSLLAGSAAMSGVNIATYVAASRKERREISYPMGQTVSPLTMGGASE